MYLIVTQAEIDASTTAGGNQRIMLHQRKRVNLESRYSSNRLIKAQGQVMYVVVERVSGHSVPNKVTLGVVPLCRLGIPLELDSLQVLFGVNQPKVGELELMVHSRGQAVLMPKSFRGTILRRYRLGL